MTGESLIGAVGAALLRHDLERLQAAGEGADGSVARYNLHKLTGAHVAAIARAVTADATLATSVTLRIPRSLVSEESVPEGATTDENAAHARNAPCSTPLLVLANTLDNLGDTLGQVTRLGAPELKANPDVWVRVLMPTLSLPADQADLWSSALVGLLGVEDVSLDNFAAYICATAARISGAGEPLGNALGWALPVLSMPRDSGLFLGIKGKDLVSSTKWKKLYQQVFSQRRPYLRKQLLTRGGIGRDLLVIQFEKAKPDIAAEYHPAIAAFIDAAPGWNAEAQVLSEFEWEKDNIRLLFDGLKKEAANLGRETADFFRMHEPEALSAREVEYLEGLIKRKSNKDPRDDDTEFFEAHRTRLSADRGLRAKWDRFIHGKGIEHDDFLVGILLAVQKLYDQADTFDGPKQIRITTQKKNKPKDWLEVNIDVLRFFCAKYRGISELTATFITWETGYLFKVDELLAIVRGKKKYKFNTSTARNSVQVKFELELRVGKGAAARIVTTQLVWQGQPNAVGMELEGDLSRVAARPFVGMQLFQRSVSKKGTLQSVALDDAGATLEPAYGRDAGSLVGTADKSTDLAKAWVDALELAQQDRLTADAATRLTDLWTQFAKAYIDAIRAWREKGIGADEVLVQAQQYGRLLAGLRADARGDLNRAKLWLPILQIGVAEVLGGMPASIVAPWHPLRMLAAHARVRSLSGLLGHILTAESVNFGDERLFFADLATEFAHPYYPEVVVGRQDQTPILLAVTETLNDYSLAEQPVRADGQATTNEGPAAAAKHIEAIVERFLDLQPHEQANLSVALYNCDSTSLPIATVDKLTTFKEDGEMRCSITLRHHDTAILGAVYGQLLESIDADPDAVIASETSRDFMAKLRIGIMLDPRENLRSDSATKPVDIAFLQDVVSRRARVEWLVAPAHEAVDTLEHVPARWSYKRSSAEDELKSTAYLTCPRQPLEGWAYLDAVHGAVAHKDIDGETHRIPVRQIVFQEADTKSLFREVHNLAEWVVNFDDLLDKRQLLSQGVKVIRHQRQRNQGRSLLVSSTSPLRILEVLVKRRLGELNLDLTANAIGELTERLISEASLVSGDIVLRAAKRGVAAGELIGLVLSKALIDEELRLVSAGEPVHTVGWYFLDDYASWLNQKEGRIADLLALNPTNWEGKPVLRAVVSEAKYVVSSDVADSRRSSAQQLNETVNRMEDALFGDPGRLDRDLWLSRLSDLLLDAVATSPAAARAFEAVRDRVRQGTLAIDLRGYSHVFVSGPEAAPVAAERAALRPRQVQEVFSREVVRKLLRAYARREPLTPIRAEIGDDQPWGITRAQQPAAAVSWIDRGPMGNGPKKKKPNGGGSGVPNGGAVPPGSSNSPPPMTGPVASAAQGSTSHAPSAPPPPGLVSSGVVSGAGVSQPSAGGELYTPSFQALVDSNAKAVVTPASTEWLTAIEHQLKTALLGYHLGAHVVGRRLTPNAGLIRLQGSDKLNVEQLEKRRSELLTTHALPIISVSARPGEIVVAIARPQRETVSLWDALQRRKVNREPSGLNRSFLLGIRELDGELLYLNLGADFGGLQQHAPHTLVAGATGSGKSVLVQNLILDICATNSPTAASVYIIDPKQGVDYVQLKPLPHIKEGIIVDQGKAEQTLDHLVAEMDRRYSVFAARGAKDLQKYNLLVAASERLPAIWLVHDEFAEWMLVEEYKAAVSAYVSRLGTKARAAGIYLIFAAQRPDNNVFPMQLRDNLGNRLVLRVESVGTSEIALKVKGAENLLGKGHLAAALTGEAGVTYAQVPYMSEEDATLAAMAIARDWSTS